jgi:alpha-glucosidase (family GH31 glycosyl hydrolase)
VKSWYWFLRISDGKWQLLSSSTHKISGLTAETVWLPRGDWFEWPTGNHFSGPIAVQRSFTIGQVPVLAQNPKALYRGTTSVVPQEPQNKPGL